MMSDRLFVLIILWCCMERCTSEHVRYCNGTNLAADGVADYRSYSGCTHIEGNLEIKHIPAYHNYDPPSDYTIYPDYPSSYMYDSFIPPLRYRQSVSLSDLSSIVEVSGYVHIDAVHRGVPLYGLRIIRGETTLSGDALVVARTGSNLLLLPSLSEITQGGVRFGYYVDTRYISTINWRDLQPDLEPAFETEEQKDMVGICHGDCTSGCWGPRQQVCQTETLTICDASCDNRCRGPGPEDCCHEECAGGCFNSTSFGCYSCRHLINGGECVRACPPRFVYNPVTSLAEQNPDFRYQHGRQCVETCPGVLLCEEEFCVMRCRVGYMEREGECIRCDGLCPEECNGLAPMEHLTGGHFDNNRLTNCTRIRGNVLINSESLKGDGGSEPISLSHLELFRTVKEITGYLVIITLDRRFTAFTFFESLEVIRGGVQYLLPSPTAKWYALVIDVAELLLADFRSLRSVGGSIYYTDTCYHNRDMFLELLTDPTDSVVEVREKTCERTRICYRECTDIGCWGPGYDQCFECRNARLADGKCIPSCDWESNYAIYFGHADTTLLCGLCHPECSGGCSGPFKHDCNECRNFIFGVDCVSSCTDDQYINEVECRECPDFCQQGCTGPEHLIGANGCNRCDFVLLDHERRFMTCMRRDDSCPEHHAVTEFPSPYSNSTVCQACDPQCKGGCMRGGNASSCAECHRHRRGDTCVKECSSSEYSDPDKICRSCDPMCLECSNSTAQDCTKCEHLMVPLEDKMECASECPDRAPFLLGIDKCVTECPENYLRVDDKRTCRPCHPACTGGCTDETKCVACGHLTLGDLCVEECPENYEEKNGACPKSDETTGDASKRSPVKVVVPVVIIILLVVSVVAIVMVVWRKKNARRSNEVNLQELSPANGQGDGIA